MLRVYVYNDEKNVWLEEESLLLHDICAILDEEEKILYLWNGPKSSSKLLEKGYKQIEELLSNYPHINFELKRLKKKIPPKIKDKIDIMLASIESEDDLFLQFSRRSTIRIFFFTTLSALLLSIISLWNIVQFFNLSDWIKNFVIKPERYDSWINISKILAIMIFLLFILNLIIGIIEYEHQVILTSVVGIIINLGIILYLNQGIYLFLFEGRSSSSFYVIAQSDINWFCITLMTTVMIYFIPMVYKFILFLKKYHEYLF